MASICWKAMASLWVDFSQDEPNDIYLQDYKIPAQNICTVLKLIWRKCTGLRHIRLGFTDIRDHNMDESTRRAGDFLNDLFELNSQYPRKISWLDIGEFFAESAFTPMLINGWSPHITDLEIWWESGKPGGSSKALWAAITRCSRLERVLLAGNFGEHDDGLDTKLVGMLGNKENIKALNLASYHQKKNVLAGDAAYSLLSENLAVLLTKFQRDRGGNDPGKNDHFRIDMTIADEIMDTGNGNLQHMIDAFSSPRTPCDGFKFVTHITIYAKERVTHFDYKPLVERFPNLRWLTIILECEEIDVSDLICDFFIVFQDFKDKPPPLLKRRHCEIFLYNKDARKVSETFGIILPKVYEEINVMGCMELPCMFTGNLSWSGDYNDLHWGVLEFLRIKFQQSELTLSVKAGERQD